MVKRNHEQRRCIANTSKFRISRIRRAAKFFQKENRKIEARNKQKFRKRVIKRRHLIRKNTVKISDKEPSIFTVPDEILTKILAYLPDPKTTASIERVSSRFKVLAWMNIPVCGTNIYNLKKHSNTLAICTVHNSYSTFFAEL